MGAEKGGGKGGGFFHLFDWNRKSRKKLFSDSPENSKQGKKYSDDLRGTRLALIDDAEVARVSKGSNTHNCSSSVVADDEFGSKAPGVIARLMGLDSLPASGIFESYSTPLIDHRSLHNDHQLMNNRELYSINQFDGLATGRPEDFRHQKVPSSPIERFRTEPLPPRSAKSLALSHNKLLSPVRNARFVSADNADHVMEAAVKIIEPGLQAKIQSRASCSSGLSVNPLRVHNNRANIASSRKASTIAESSKKVAEASKYRRGKVPSSGWDSLDTASSTFRPYARRDESNDVREKSRGRSVSLAIQAKVNVQRREGIFSGVWDQSIRLEAEECKLSPPLYKSQASNQKQKQRKKSSLSNSSSVLRQNNQKQNSSAIKDKSSVKKTFSSQQGRKVVSADVSSGKHKNIVKPTAKPKVAYFKDATETRYLEKEDWSSNNKSFSQKKRLLECSSHLENTELAANMINRYAKCAKPSVTIDEVSHSSEDIGGNGSDIVSFTFTSPMMKTVSQSSASSCVLDSNDMKKISLDTERRKSSPNPKDSNLSSLELDKFSGDVLGLLLDQKLKELASVLDPSQTSFGSYSMGDSESLHESTSNTEHERESLHAKTRKSVTYDMRDSSADGWMTDLSCRTQKVDSMECSSSSVIGKKPERQHLSPLSIFDATFSTSHCGSSESSTNTDESKMECSSVQAQAAIGSLGKDALVDNEMDLLDSATSTCRETSKEEHSAILSGRSSQKDTESDLDYVQEILFKNKLKKEDLPLCHFLHAGKILKPENFGKCKEEKLSRFRKSVLFDCIEESLGDKCRLYFKAGYQAWTKGKAIIGENLAEELCKDISALENMADLTADELVDKDMSSHLGSWLHFDVEAFETGMEIERKIISSLIHEVVVDILVKG